MKRMTTIMTSVTVAMSAQLEDLKGQVRVRSSWGKPIYVPANSQHQLNGTSSVKLCFTYWIFTFFVLTANYIFVLNSRGSGNADSSSRASPFQHLYNVIPTISFSPIKMCGRFHVFQPCLQKTKMWSCQEHHLVPQKAHAGGQCEERPQLGTRLYIPSGCFKGSIFFNK